MVRSQCETAACRFLDIDRFFKLMPPADLFYKSVRVVIKLPVKGRRTGSGRPLAVSKAWGECDVIRRSGGGSKAAGRQPSDFTCHRPATWRTPAIHIHTDRRLGVLTATARPRPIIWRRQVGLQGIYIPRLLSYHYKVYFWFTITFLS